VPDVRELRPALAEAAIEAQAAIEERLAAHRNEIAGLLGRAQRASPARRVGESRQRVDDVTRRSQLAVSNLLRGRRMQLDGILLQLNALDPARVLDRGYAIVLHESAVISSVAAVGSGDLITVRVADGAFDATVDGTQGSENQ
jgi:exodeoxyribonuclease VII large subunit